MDSLTTKSAIDKAREVLLAYKPYDKNDPILKKYDGGSDPYREQATFAREWLEALGLDPYNKNDYGNITE